MFLMDNRYVGWTEQCNGVNYLVSPDNDRIAYLLRGKMVELTFDRHIGGGVGPKEMESTEDYVRRKTNGALKKREVRGLARILENLS